MKTKNSKISLISICKGMTFILLSTFIMSCQNDDSASIESDVNATQYQLADVMFVNEENGIPRKPENIDLLPEELQFYKEGPFISANRSNNLKNRIRMVEENSVLLFNQDVPMNDLILKRKSKDILEITYPYQKGEGYSSGYICCTYIRIEQPLNIF